MSPQIGTRPSPLARRLELIRLSKSLVSWALARKTSARALEMISADRTIHFVAPVIMVDAASAPITVESTGVPTATPRPRPNIRLFNPTSLPETSTSGPPENPG